MGAFQMMLGSVAECVTAFAAICALYVAWTQLRAMRRISSADFLQKLKVDFFTAKTAEIFQLLDAMELRFVGEEKEGKSYFVSKGGKIITIHQMDFYVMMPLENLGSLTNSGLVEVDIAYDIFSWHALLVWRNDAVQEYVTWGRSDPEDWDIFLCLQALCEKFEACEAQRKRRHTSIAK